MAIKDEHERMDRLCELNILEQTVNVCQTTVVQGAWERGQPLAIHGLIYGLHDGLLRDLNIRISNADEMLPVWKKAVAALK